MLEHREASRLKAELRRVMRKRLRGMSPADRQQKSLRAVRNAIVSPPFREAGVVMVYLSMAYEVDTSQLIREAWAQHKDVAVPKMRWDEGTMLPVRLNSLADCFSEEIPGLRNPVSEDAVPPAEIDLLILPLLAMDDRGNRLGQGGGHFDRFLTKSDLQALRCGLAFDEQRVECVPTIETDQPLDMIITDRVTYRVGSSR